MQPMFPNKLPCEAKKLRCQAISQEQRCAGSALHFLLKIELGLETSVGSTLAMPRENATSTTTSPGFNQPRTILRKSVVISPYLRTLHTVLFDHPLDSNVNHFVVASPPQAP